MRNIDLKYDNDHILIEELIKTKSFDSLFRIAIHHPYIFPTLISEITKQCENGVINEGNLRLLQKISVKFPQHKVDIAEGLLSFDPQMSLPQWVIEQNNKGDHERMLSLCIEKGNVEVRE